MLVIYCFERFHQFAQSAPKQGKKQLQGTKRGKAQNPKLILGKKLSFV